MRGKSQFRDRWKCAAGGATALGATAFRRFGNCFPAGSPNVGTDRLDRSFVKRRELREAVFGFRSGRSGIREYSAARQELCWCAVT